MKFVFQLCVILLVSFVGEILRQLLPLPIPASIYGLLIMLFLLITKLLKVENVKKAGHFLIDVMPLMFIPPAVGLIDVWGQISGILVPLIVITLATTVVVMVVAGKVAQAALKKDRSQKHE